MSIFFFFQLIKPEPAPVQPMMISSMLPVLIQHIQKLHHKSKTQRYNQSTEFGKRKWFWMKEKQTKKYASTPIDNVHAANQHFSMICKSHETCFHKIPAKLSVTQAQIVAACRPQFMNFRTPILQVNSFKHCVEKAYKIRKELNKTFLFLC